jgi:S1-C subfamily serine protease
MKLLILSTIIALGFSVLAGAAQDPLADRVETLSPSVVRLMISLDRASDQKSKNFPESLQGVFVNGVCIAGSGFFVDTDGYIVTAAHVIDGMVDVATQLNNAGIPFTSQVGFTEPTIDSSNFQSYGYTATNLTPDMKLDFARDLAVLRPAMNPIRDNIGTYTGSSDHLVGYAYRPHPLGLNTQKVASGQSIFLVGFPSNSPVPQTTSGIISAPLQFMQTIEAKDHKLPNSIGLLIADIRINPGNSGGPIFSSSTGNVLGIVDEGDDSSGGLAYVVPSKEIIEFLDENHIAWTLELVPVSAPKLPPPPGRGKPLSAH